MPVFTQERWLRCTRAGWIWGWTGGPFSISTTWGVWTQKGAAPKCLSFTSRNDAFIIVLNKEIQTFMASAMIIHDSKVEPSGKPASKLSPQELAKAMGFFPGKLHDWKKTQALPRASKETNWQSRNDTIICAPWNLSDSPHLKPEIHFQNHHVWRIILYIYIYYVH